MSKRRARVPDFSTKRPVAKLPIDAQPKTQAPPQKPTPTVKPPATSSKSGRRGS